MEAVKAVPVTESDLVIALRRMFAEAVEREVVQGDLVALPYGLFASDLGMDKGGELQPVIPRGLLGIAERVRSEGVDVRLEWGMLLESVAHAKVVAMAVNEKKLAEFIARVRGKSEPAQPPIISRAVLKGYGYDMATVSDDMVIDLFHRFEQTVDENALLDDVLSDWVVWHKVKHMPLSIGDSVMAKRLLIRMEILDCNADNEQDVMVEEGDDGIVLAIEGDAVLVEFYDNERYWLVPEYLIYSDGQPVEVINTYGEGK